MSALESLYEWFKEQLSRASESSEEFEGETLTNDAENDGGPPDVVNTQKAFVETQIKAILEALGAPQNVKSRVVTVRKRFCRIHRYLRPVYAEPPDLNPFLTQPDQQTAFNVEFVDDDAAVFGAIPNHMRIRGKDTFLCIHRIDNDLNGHATAEAKTIAERLTRFWQNNLMGAGSGAKPAGFDFVRRVDKLNHLKLSPGKALFCIFAGSLGHAEVGYEPELKALFGAYLVLSEDWLPFGKLDLALHAAADLFRGLEFISQMDSKLFELQGLRRMATLLPDFVKEDMPRSDKISAALSSLKDQLNQHLVGRPDWEGGVEPKLFYLSASFERVEHGWFPRLEVYPHAYRDAFPLVSLLVSHAEVPSASKFLLKTYLDRQWDELSMGKAGVTLDPDFAKLFTSDNLKVPELQTWQKRVMRGDEATCLHMVEHDEKIAALVTGDQKNPWEVLNHSVDSSGTPSTSLLAFVIEGERRSDGRAFPRGILALESSAIDAFSDQDIGALRVVVKAFGSLVRLITHDNACLEYRTRLSEAFHAELRDNLPEDTEALARFRKFVFAVKKIDGTQFNKLLDEAIPNSRDSERIWSLLKLEADDVKTLTAFKSKIESVDDEAVPDQITANQIVAERVEWAIEEVQKLVQAEELVGNLNKNVVEFLFACTENFQWSAYLSSMAQTLGDRATKSVPKFQMMTPGYSASRMFMASVSQELRQVVKLSEYSKLSKEREKYKEYVRYRLVNSARMPVNGFAFDGIGWHDPSKRIVMNERFGALVSDLISAERGERHLVKTFVTLLCDCIDRGFKHELHTQIYHSIRGLFDHGTSLWQEDTIDIKSIGPFVRSASRLPRYRKAMSSERGHKLSCALSAYHHLFRNGNTEDGMLKLMFEPPNTMPTKEDFSSLLYQISHRDLNARNLTWSSALNTFLMIDFEHVGQGYLGHDQARLWINSICDLYAEAIVERVPEERIENVLNAVDKLIDNTRYFLQYLASRTLLEGDAFINYVRYFVPNAYSGDTSQIELTNLKFHDGIIKEDDYFKTFFVSLLLNFPQVQGLSGLIVYSFYCNALKEFQYSCEDIIDTKLDDILVNIRDLVNTPSIDIHNVLEGESTLNAATQGLYFRHLAAARLLKVAYEALGKLKGREARRP